MGGGRFTNTAIVAVISRWLGIAMADTSSVSASDKAPYQARSPLSSLSGPPGGGASPDKSSLTTSLGALSPWIHKTLDSDIGLQSLRSSLKGCIWCLEVGQNSVILIL